MAAGVLNGVSNTLEGKSFADGYVKSADETADQITAFCVSFGDEHNDTIKEGVVRGAAEALGGAVVRRVAKRPTSNRS